MQPTARSNSYVRGAFAGRGGGGGTVGQAGQRHYMPYDGEAGGDRPWQWRDGHKLRRLAPAMVEWITGEDGMFFYQKNLLGIEKLLERVFCANFLYTRNYLE